MTITNSSLRLVALVTGVAVAIALMGAVAIAPAQAAGLTQTQIQSIVSLLASFGADSATISNVTAALNGQATTGTTGGTNPNTGMCPALVRSLQVGSNGADVKALQMFLNSSKTTQVSVTGAGSPGNESTYFGAATKAAVVKFQAANNVSAIGIVGPATRAAIAATCGKGNNGGTTGGTTGGTGGTTVGGSLTVSAAAQPVNSLAPAGASRVPFTTFTLTNSSSAAATVTGITVERTGLGVDANFSGVVLLDSNGLQIGTSKTFNSNHQAVVGDTFTIGAGQSMTLTVAGNIAAAATAQAGQIVSIQVDAINTGATLAGSLPIVGASQTINTTLTLGTVSTTTSSFDPGVAQTKNIGDTAVRFSGVRYTAGSAEDLKLYSVRWRQVGTASASDIANIVTIANGVSYPTTIDASGKYYTTVFPGGLMITKGNSIDVYTQGDLVGSNAASRTVDFDIDKVTDIYFVGQTYGFGIAPSGTYTPWYNGYVTTINAGTVTSIGKATEVPAQNIAVNVSNQPLGGFAADFKGEAVSVTQMVFNLNYSSGAASSNLVTSVSLVDENGKVVAGPKDGVDAGGTAQTVTFSDTVTFATGRHIYTLKGKIPTTVANGVTIQASTTPSGWSNPTGQTSGNTISIGTANFTMNTMTIKAATLGINMSATPSSQTVIAGGQNVLFANVQLDATQSGEDLRISSLPIRFTVAAGAVVGDVTSCRLYDGTTALNTGSNVPTVAASGTKTTFTLDNSLTVPKGTVKVLALKCNLSSSAATSGTYIASVNSGDTFSATGSSGTSVTPTVTTGNSGTMTAGAASLSITTDPSSPSYTIATAGSTGVTIGAYKISATNDAVMLNRIGLNLGTVTASSTAADLTQVYLYTGSGTNLTLVGTATFVGSSRQATSTLSTPITIAKDTSVTLTVKADLPVQNNSSAAHPGALLTVDIDVNGASGNKNTSGTGVSGSGTVDPTGSTAVAGVRVFKTSPVVARVAPVNTTLLNQTGLELYRFTITANAAGDLGLNKIVVNVATSSQSTTNGSTTVTNLKVFAYTDSALSTGVAGYTNGQVVATIATVNSGDNAAAFSSAMTIPKGMTYYFKVTGDITQVAGTSATKGTVTTKLTGDTAYPSLATLLDTYTNVSGSNFVWSPISTSTTLLTTNLDWTNGFNVLGLPSSGTDATTLSN